MRAQFVPVNQIHGQSTTLVLRETEIAVLRAIEITGTREIGTITVLRVIETIIVPRETDRSSAPMVTGQPVPRETDHSVPMVTDQLVPREIDHSVLTATDQPVPRETDRSVLMATDQPVPRETDRNVLTVTDQPVLREIDHSVHMEIEMAVPRETDHSFLTVIVRLVREIEMAVHRVALAVTKNHRWSLWILD